MTEKTLGKVCDVAKKIVDINQPYYSEELLELVPVGLMERELINDNFHKTALEIDQLRFQKQYELLNLLGISVSPDSEISDSIWRELGDVINNGARFEGLSSEQRKKVKEIKFLSNVALTVLHQ